MKGSNKSRWAIAAGLIVVVPPPPVLAQPVRELHGTCWRQ